MLVLLELVDLPRGDHQWVERSELLEKEVALGRGNKAVAAIDKSRAAAQVESSHVEYNAAQEIYQRQAETDEKNAQEDYEQFMNDAANKRAQDSKSITDKTAAQADSESQFETDKDSLKSTQYQLMENDKMIGSLHAECDFLLRYYDLRKEARTGEIDALSKAKDVLKIGRASCRERV